MNLNIIKYKNIFLIASTTLVVLAVISIFVFGFRLGVDFTSGSLWRLKIPDTNTSELKDFFATKVNLELSSSSYDEQSQSYTLTFKEISDSEKQSYTKLLKDRFGQGVEELDFLSISPSVSSELKQKAILAIVFVLLAISIYVAFAFRKVSYPVKSWKYGVITLITLFHDVIIPLGLFAFLSYKMVTEIDINFIVAALVIMGFSVHDTIVVFDRIRENLLINRNRDDLARIINNSINQTLARSINTSLTLFLVLLTMLFLGPVSLRYFTLAILVGTIIGTYSSIFLASPALLLSVRKNN